MELSVFPHTVSHTACRGVSGGEKKAVKKAFNAGPRTHPIFYVIWVEQPQEPHQRPEG